jgi:Mg2+-importing ATPase
MFGVTLLVALIAVVLDLHEMRETARIVRQAQPGWLVMALLLQAATYLAQGGIWRSVARAANESLSMRRACLLSLTKLFVDQTLPSGGLSGTMMVTRALEHDGLSRPVRMAAAVITMAGYYGAQALCVGLALGIVLADGQRSPLVVALALAALCLATAMSFGVLQVSRLRDGAMADRLQRLPVVRTLLTAMRGAAPELVRRPGLLAWATALQTAIVCLDAATLWILIRALGSAAAFAGIFAGFVVANLVRVLAVLPGGIGLFEAASVVALRLAGVPVTVALPATLAFRFLSLWLPMLPGVLFLRRILRHASPGGAGNVLAYWSLEAAEIARRLGSDEAGLSSGEAARRLRECGPNTLREQGRLSRITVLWNQLRSPLLLLLVFAAVASAFAGGWTDAAMVLVIVVASAGIGYSQEYRAQRAVAELQARVRTRATAVRDGRPVILPAQEIVPGDVVLLSAGSLVPADAVVIEETDCFVNQAVLTGESYPVEKRRGAVPPDAPLAQRANCVFLGTNVRNGTARCLVVRTGTATEFGTIARRLTLRPPETEFDRGVRRFGYLLTSAMSVMVLAVFAGNVVLGRPPIETLLFAVALAVGLSPELMPVILNVNLARGARAMARHGVLVKRLNAIENLGSMDVLCTDKTGTLTEGVVRLEGAYDPDGRASADVLELASWNAALQAGLANPLDEAILQAHRPALDDTDKLAEIPYDFVRRRLSVVVRRSDAVRLVTKGAVDEVLAVCTSVDGRPLDATARQAVQALVRSWTARGIRVLGVAERVLPAAPSYGRTDESELRFRGLLTFVDHPKEGIDRALAGLAGLGVTTKVITGDAELVARYVAVRVGLRAERVLTGRQLDELHDEALWHAAERTDLFVEVDPNQKERIIRSLKKMGHVVGFLGDGVNDAPAMHAADASLSVDHAVEVAKEAADFVLLERDLEVIRRGIEEGRRTFANTLKYVLITTSANLGNMMSMAAASLVLPFLPLLAGQILLNNFLSDLPAIGLADDRVDRELVDRPRRWDLRFIGRFMVVFGGVSSVFDLLTFGALLGLFAAGVELFRTGWFVESLLTELVVVLVMRTWRPFYRSRPGRLLVVLTIAVLALTLAIPALPGAALFGFVPLPLEVMAVLIAITVAYVLATELVKRRFFGDERPATPACRPSSAASR